MWDSTAHENVIDSIDYTPIDVLRENCYKRNESYLLKCF